MKLAGTFAAPAHAEEREAVVALRVLAEEAEQGLGDLVLEVVSGRERRLRGEKTHVSSGSRRVLLLKEQTETWSLFLQRKRRAPAG